MCLLGAALMFRQDGLMDLAGLAWIVALLHLAGHALAKGALFLSADGVYRATGDYRLVQRGILGRSPWVFGVGALFAAMSLAAMPPQAGFVSEWYLFQTFFQGFHLAASASRLTAALAGAGLALTAAIAFATFVKVFGIGLLGRGDRRDHGRCRSAIRVAVGLLGVLVLALAVGMPVWLDGARARRCPAAFGERSGRQDACRLAAGAGHGRADPGAGNIRLHLAEPARHRDAAAGTDADWAAAPVEPPARRAPAPVWYGGREQDPPAASTTALTFSNALRTFYSFIYRPTVGDRARTGAGSNGQPLFRPAARLQPRCRADLRALSLRAAGKAGRRRSRERLRLIQSGQLNFYLSLIGALLVAILVIALV